MSANTQNMHVHTPPLKNVFVSEERQLKQAILQYDVHVSDPVKDASSTPSWPGREPERVQTRLDSFLVGSRTAAANSHQPHGVGIESMAD